MSQESRSAILARVRAATGELTPVPLPGPLVADSHPDEVVGSEALLRAFSDRLTGSGGQVVSFADPPAFSAWLVSFLEGPDGKGGWVAGSDVPPAYLPPGPQSPSHEAGVGISAARAAAARSGTVVLDSRGDRRVQLLPGTHIVLVRRETVFADLASALAGLDRDLPSGLGLHSGPSKSADIGRTLVTGVHGPGRLIAAVLLATG